MLAHDLANKLAAVVSHCDLLQLEVEPGSAGSEHAEKIRVLAMLMADMLRTRECEQGAWDEVENTKTGVLA